MNTLESAQPEHRTYIEQLEYCIYIEQPIELPTNKKIQSVQLGYQNSLLFTFSDERKESPLCQVFRVTLKGHILDTHIIESNKMETMKSHGNDILLHGTTGSRVRVVQLYSLRTRRSKIICDFIYFQRYQKQLCYFHGFKESGLFCACHLFYDYYVKRMFIFSYYRLKNSGSQLIAQTSINVLQSRLRPYYMGSLNEYSRLYLQLEGSQNYLVELTGQRVKIQEVSAQDHGATGPYYYGLIFRPEKEIGQHRYLGFLYQRPYSQMNLIVKYCTMRLQTAQNQEKGKFVLEKMLVMMGEPIQQREASRGVKNITSTLLQLLTLTKKITMLDQFQRQYSLEIKKRVRLLDLVTLESTVLDLNEDEEQIYFLPNELVVKIKKISAEQKEEARAARIIFTHLPIKDVYMDMILHINEDFDDDLLMDAIFLLLNE